MPDSSFNDPAAESIRKRLLVGKIVIGAQMAGALVFGCVVALTPAKISGSNLIVPIGLAGACLVFLARIFVSNLIAERARKRIVAGTFDADSPQGRELAESAGDAGRLANVFFNIRIVRSSMLEGAIFFLLVTYMVQRQGVSLAMAGVLWVALAREILEFNRFTGWVEAQLDLIENERAVR